MTAVYEHPVDMFPHLLQTKAGTFSIRCCCCCMANIWQLLKVLNLKMLANLPSSELSIIPWRRKNTGSFVNSSALFLHWLGKKKWRNQYNS